MDVSVIVPIRCDGVCGGHEQLRSSLRSLRRSGAHVVVADGSDPASIAPEHRAIFEGLDHVLVSSHAGRNGKVAGVRAGVAAAAHERVVLVDDDVLYDPATLEALARRLDDSDLVVPQNHFIRPAPWHATWDTARTLINRAAGMDYPGTLAIRRSMFADTTTMSCSRTWS
jgi:GT2 family glycosyltransferase